ncbi:g1621 [Coccomyxa elongata]
MGVAMSRNLLKAGYDVTVWNRSPEKCKMLEAEGAKVAASPEDATAACDITFAMLADPPAALAVAEQAARGLSEGKGYVDVSTVDAGTSQKVAKLVHAAGAQYLEAPVSGSKGPAEQGTLIFLAGGDEELYERSGPMLDVMGKAKFFLGPVGKGANMKLVVNMLLGTYMAASAEGLALADALGLKQQDVVDVVALGAVATPMLALKAPAMLEGRYPTAFPLKHQQKDLRLALQAAGEGSLKLPVAAAANSLYLEAQEKGLGDADFSAVLESVKPAAKET